MARKKICVVTMTSGHYNGKKCYVRVLRNGTREYLPHRERDRATTYSKGDAQNAVWLFQHISDNAHIEMGKCSDHPVWKGPNVEKFAFEELA